MVAPPDTYRYEPCVATHGGIVASYETLGGAAPYFTATSGAELKTSLENLLNSVVSCTFDMDAIVTGNPALGSVSVGTQAAPYGDPNGWRLEPNRYQVTLQGSACELFQTGDHPLNISFPCDPITGMPIAVKR